MRNNHSAQLRALYIILVPIVVLIIILNSGFLQKALPAAKVHGTSYSVVRYNYYYYDYYNSFLDENAARLSELGYDPSVSASGQACSLENDTITWKEYFQRGAEYNMSETAYYCTLAEQEGYVFSAEELMPVTEQLAENAAFQKANNINAKNYYIAYYGSGMTEAIYTEELTRQVKARAYRNHLVETAELDPNAVAAYAGTSTVNYRAVDIRVITLEAVPDRATGEIGSAQLTALRERLNRLVKRWQGGESFEALQAAFSTDTLGDRNGVLTNAVSSDLPPVVAQVLLTNQTSLVTGQMYTAVDEESGTAYFILLDGFGDYGAQREASLELGLQAVEEAAAEAIEGQYAVVQVKPGILLATG